MSAPLPDAEALRRRINDRLPALSRLARPSVPESSVEAGRPGVGEHAARLLALNPRPLQPRRDFLEAAAAVCAEALGDGLARRCRETLEAAPVCLTANHLGLETQSQSLQSTIALALPRLLAEDDAGVTPVLACGVVPLGNVTFPMGLLCSRVMTCHAKGEAGEPASTDEPEETDETRTLRFPLFPSRSRQTLVSLAPAVPASALRRVRDRALAEPGLHPAQRRTMAALLDAFALAPPAGDFSTQASRWNALLWARLFRPGVPAPPLAFLELERVATRLLLGDFANPHSLLHALCFEEATRSDLLDALDGCPGCWNRERLARLRALDRPRHEDYAGCGTCFAWGLDGQGRQIPLWLESGPAGWRLAGRGREGEAVSLPWTPSAAAEALTARRLLPSLFTSYASLALARGVVCAGGLHQASYLARMAAGAGAVLARRGDASLRDLDAGWHLAGVHLAVLRVGDEALPAHGPDLAAAGGLDAGHVRAMADLDLEAAMLAGLPQTLPEVLAPHERPPGWGRALRQAAATRWAPGMAALALQADPVSPDSPDSPRTAAG